MISGPSLTRAGRAVLALALAALAVPAQNAAADAAFEIAEGGIFGSDGGAPREDLPEGHPCRTLSAAACAAEAASLAARIAVLEGDLAAAREAAAAIPGLDADLAAARARIAALEAAAPAAEGAAAEERIAELEAEIAALRPPELAAGHPCAGVTAAGCADIAADMARRADELAAAAESLGGLPEGHPCAGRSAADCAGIAAEATARLAEIEPGIAELESRARAALRYKTLSEQSAIEIERLTGELAACAAAPACAADPAFVEQQQALAAAEARAADLEARLAAATATLDAGQGAAADLEAALAATEADLAARTAELARITAARDAALVEFTAVQGERDAAQAGLAAASAELTGLRTANDALERENARLAEELRAQRDLPRIQAALAALPCGQPAATLEPGIAVAVLAGSPDEAAGIGATLAALGGGFVFEIGVAPSVPGAGCPAVVAPGWAALRWEGEPADVTASIVGSDEAERLLASLPEAARCAELARFLEGRAARFWVREDGRLAVCDVRRGALDNTLNARAASAALLMAIEPVATVGGG